MKIQELFKLLPVAAALATFAASSQAANWGAWSNNTNLRSAQFIQTLQNLTVQANTQLVNAAFNAPSAATTPATNATTNTLPSTNVQLGNATMLLSVTGGQMLNPATGQPTGAIGGAGGAGGGAGGAGGGSTAATITLPADMIWGNGTAGISAAEIATGRVTIVCPDPFFCDVKNPASTFANNGSDVATQQAWGIWRGSANATSAMYLKQAPNGSIINFSANNAQSSYAYAIGPMFTGVLPATGTFNYVYLGGVITDVTSGAIGTVNSAALTVNFTAATVQNSLNATIAGTTYAVNTPASPILANASSGVGTTCTPACAASTFAWFNGVSGAGAIVQTNIGPGTIVANTVFKR